MDLEGVLGAATLVKLHYEIPFTEPKFNINDLIALSSTISYKDKLKSILILLKENVKQVIENQELFNLMFIYYNASDFSNEYKFVFHFHNYLLNFSEEEITAIKQCLLTSGEEVPLITLEVTELLQNLNDVIENDEDLPSCYFDLVEKLTILLEE